MNYAEWERAWIAWLRRKRAQADQRMTKQRLMDALERGDNEEADRIVAEWAARQGRLTT